MIRISHLAAFTFGIAIALTTWYLDKVQLSEATTIMASDLAFFVITYWALFTISIVLWYSRERKEVDANG